MRIGLWKNFWLDVCALSVAVAFSTLLVIGYVSKEQAFYYWDYGAYQELAHRFAVDLFNNPIKAFLQLWLSTINDYNYYFALPLAPVALFSSGSRNGYILGVTLIYQMPYVLTLGALATRLIQGNKRVVFWLTVFIALLTPMAWAPTLRGYPDVAAAWMVALAILLLVDDPQLLCRRTVIGIGILLAIAILLRRHFSYDVLAFYIILLFFSVLEFFRRMQYSTLSRSIFIDMYNDFGKKVGLSGATLLLALGLLGTPFLAKALLIRYGSLYASYSSPGIVLRYYLDAFGYITWGLVVLGYWFGGKYKILHTTKQYYLGGLLLLNLALWSVIIRITGTHYTLHISTYIILGISAWFWSLWRERRKPRYMVLLILTGVYLAVNLLFALSLLRVNTSIQAAFSRSYPPLVREDYNEIERLIHYLRVVVSPEEDIYVVDSSTSMSYSVLDQANRTISGTQPLNILRVPEVDSRDSYPLEDLMKAEFVIVSIPFQHHLALEEQKIPYWVYDTFLTNQGIAQDFSLLPESFSLENGAVLHIYKRSKLTPADTAIQAFNHMIDFIKRPPGQQPDWIILKGSETIFSRKIIDQSYSLLLGGHNKIETNQESIYIYAERFYGNLTIEGVWSITGNICPEIEVNFIITSAQGDELRSRREIWTDEGKQYSYSIDFTELEGQYLLLIVREISPDSDFTACQFSMDWTLDIQPVKR